MPLIRSPSASPVAMLAAGLVVANGSLLNAGLPLVGCCLAASPRDLPWVVSAYFLPLGALLPLAGAAGDSLGRRRPICAGLLAAALGSLICAVAVHLSVMLLGRLVQGAGAALVLPNAVAVVSGYSQAGTKTRALGAYAAVCATAAAGGPILGAWFLDHGAWLVLFLGSALASTLAALFVIASVNESTCEVPPRADLAGGSVATLLFAALALAVAVGGPVRAVALGVAVFAAVGLVSMVRRGRCKAAVCYQLYSVDFATLIGFTFLIYGVLFAVLLLEPFTLMSVAGYSGAAAAAALLPLPATVVALAPLVVRIQAFVPARLLLAWAAAAVALGILLLLWLDPRGDYVTTVLPALVMFGAGMCLAGAPLTTATLAIVPASHAGVAVGLSSAAARLGGAVSTALLTQVFAHHGLEALAVIHHALAVEFVFTSMAVLLLSSRITSTLAKREITTPFTVNKPLPVPLYEGYTK